MTWSEFRGLITTQFDVEELRTLCFDLNVDYDTLRGEGKAAKVRELVAYFRRRGRLPALVAGLSTARPDVPWKEILEQHRTPAQTLTESRPVIWVLGAAALVVIVIVLLILMDPDTIPPDDDTNADAITPSQIIENENTTPPPVPRSPESSNPGPTAFSTGGRISLDQTITGELVSSEAHTWIFDDGPATIDVILDMGPLASAVIILLDPDGQQLKYVDVPDAQGVARLINFEIPDSRAYTLIVDNALNQPTPYTLTVRTTPPPPTIQLNQTVTGTLYYDEANTWIFDGGPATINILLDAGSFADGVLLLFDPQGNQLQYVDANHAGGKEQLLNLHIPDARDYRILVTQAQPRLSHYALSVEPSAVP